MINNKTIAVIGGDSRQIYAAEYLKAHGFSTIAFALELAKKTKSLYEAKTLCEAMKCDYILLPLPVAKSGNNLNAPFSEKKIKLKEIVDTVNEKHTVFLGMGTPSFTKQLEAKAKNVCDYFKIEELTYKNALLTAEGLIGIIIDALPVIVFNLPVAVTGYGRVGYFTSKLLKALGAQVTVFARNSLQLTKAETNGIKAEKLDLLKDLTENFQCIINTVPTQIIGEEIISLTKPDCVFIESASSPYGIDFDAAAKHGRTLIKAFSLPGKTAPKTAGVIIGEVVKSFIQEADAVE